MVTVIPQSARHLGRHFGRHLVFFKKFEFMSAGVKDIIVTNVTIPLLINSFLVPEQFCLLERLLRANKLF